jgi:hypothetical protein
MRCDASADLIKQRRHGTHDELVRGAWQAHVHWHRDRLHSVSNHAPRQRARAVRALRVRADRSRAVGPHSHKRRTASREASHAAGEFGTRSTSSSIAASAPHGAAARRAAAYAVDAGERLAHDGRPCPCERRVGLARPHDNDRQAQAARVDKPAARIVVDHELAHGLVCTAHAERARARHASAVDAALRAWRGGVGEPRCGAWKPYVMLLFSGV